MISSHQPYATLVNKLSSLFSFEEYKEDFFMWLCLTKQAI